MAKLVVQSGAASGQELTLIEGLNRVGRELGMEVCLADPGVSAIHCEFWLMQERLLVRDLNSTNGTLVDGRPISEAEVHDGHLVSVGGVDLLVKEAPCRVGIPRPEPPSPPPPRFTPDGIPLCVRHPEAPADYRCTKCGEQFCGECVRLLGRRGGRQHAYCPSCDGECVSTGPQRAGTMPGGAAAWMRKLTQTLRLKR